MINALDVENIYEVPLVLERGAGGPGGAHLGLAERNLAAWAMVDAMRNPVDR